MNKCGEIELLLPWLLNDTLEPKEKKETYSHVSRCDSCRRELVNITRLQELWDDSRPQEETERQNRLFDNMVSQLAMERVEPSLATKSVDIQQLNLIEQLQFLYRMELQNVKKRVEPAIHDLGKVGLFVRQVMISVR